MAYSILSCCQGPIDSCPALYYEPEYNRFFDDDGQLINDLHEMLDPWQILYMKEEGKKSGYCVIKTKSGGLLEVFFPSPWSDSTYWEQLKAEYDERESYYRYAVDKDD